MSLTLQQIRDFVRGHLDLDTEDLPDAILDVFIREGSKRIENIQYRWTFYEQSWTFNTVVGQKAYPFSSISPEIDDIASVARDDGPLEWVGADVYGVLNPEDSASQSKPWQYTWWGSTLYLNPTPNDIYTLTVRGYRKPIDWVADGAGAVPDLPDQLHNTVATWALSKAYTQQEDPELGLYYERQFREELDEFQKSFVYTPYPQPLVLNGTNVNLLRPWGPPRFDWMV